VDLVVPSIECDVYEWNDHRSAIEASGTTALLNSANLVSLCRDGMANSGAQRTSSR